MKEVTVGAQSAQKKDISLTAQLQALDDLKKDSDKQAMHSIIGSMHQGAQNKN